MKRFTEKELDLFHSSYCEAIAFTETPEENFDEGYRAELDDALIQIARKDCETFLKLHCDLLHKGANDAVDSLMSREGLTHEDAVMSQGGYDFWMTRNGHGVGFWETPDWKAGSAAELDAAAQKFGTFDVDMLNDKLSEL